MKTVIDERWTKRTLRIHALFQIGTLGRNTCIFSFALASLLTSDAVACEQVRAAFDIGSGTTKMVVALVNYCEHRVVQVLAPTAGTKLERMVEYNKYTVEDSTGKKVFADAVIAQGLTAILELKAVAMNYRAQAFSAVATSAFRSVDSGHLQVILERIRRETDFRLW